MKTLLFLLLFAASLMASAQPAATVEGVQMPAWVERSGQRVPVAPGMVLQQGDLLQTGAGSKALVRLAERSVVKLGENGQLRFTEISPGQQLFRAAFGVLQGAFRFTTDVAAKARRREVNITAGTVTAGIRGTDLWGRSVANNEIVCLIEGVIEVGAQGEAPVTMDQPLQFFRRVNGQTQPVGVLDKAQLEQWARETEIERGRGAARLGGRFSADLGRSDNQGAALGLYDQLRAAGYPAEIRPVREGEQTVYVVRIRNLPSAAEARALEKELRAKFVE